MPSKIESCLIGQFPNGSKKADRSLMENFIALFSKDYVYGHKYCPNKIKA